MRCEHCGSERINYERDAFLVAAALRLEGATLVLGSEPSAQGLDDVRLCCLDCGQGQDSVKWDDERPEHDPAGAMVDAEVALDCIAAYINEPGECQGADFVEFVSQLLPQTGREVVDSDV
jgi:hypothetical protein